MDVMASNQLRHKQISVIRVLATDLGSATCQKIQLECDRLQAALRLGTARHVVMDCSGTVSLGCTALGLLLRVGKTTQRHGGHFAVCSLSPLGLEVVRLVKLHRVWALYNSTTEALDAIGKIMAKSRPVARLPREAAANPLSHCG